MGVMVAEGRNVLLNPSVRVRCANEATAFCLDVEPGDSRMLVCLRAYEDKPGFSGGCLGALRVSHLSEIMNKTLSKRIKALKRGVLLRSNGLGIAAVVTATAVVLIATVVTCLIFRRRQKTLHDIEVAQREEDQ